MGYYKNAKRVYKAGKYGYKAGKKAVRYGRRRYAKYKRSGYMKKRRSSPKYSIKGPRMPVMTKFAFKTCLEFTHFNAATKNNTIAVVRGNNPFQP